MHNDDRIFSTWGPVRGSCGHQHQSLSAAADCLARDQRACQRQRGYSDRSVVAAVVGPDPRRKVSRDFEIIDANEQDEVFARIRGDI